MPKPGYWVIVEDGKTVRVRTAARGARLEAMQQIVHGSIECFWHHPSRHRPGVDLDFYCNEDGMAEGLAPNCAVQHPDPGRMAWHILGPMLITGGDANGETVGLTADEARDIRLVRFKPEWPGPPLLQIRGVRDWETPEQEQARILATPYCHGGITHHEITVAGHAAHILADRSYATRAQRVALTARRAADMVAEGDEPAAAWWRLVGRALDEGWVRVILAY